MRKIALFLIFFIGFLSFGQEKNATNYDVTKIANYSYIKTKIDLTDIPSNPDTMPEFPDGINAFRDKFTKKIDLFNLKMESGQTMKTKAYFIIEKDGKISNVIAIGDIKYSEAVEKGIKKIKDIWKPATLNGEPVRYLFVWPLGMVNH